MDRERFLSLLQDHQDAYTHVRSQCAGKRCGKHFYDPQVKPYNHILMMIDVWEHENAAPFRDMLDFLDIVVDQYDDFVNMDIILRAQESLKNDGKFQGRRLWKTASCVSMMLRSFQLFVAHTPALREVITENRGDEYLAKLDALLLKKHDEPKLTPKPTQTPTSRHTEEIEIIDEKEEDKQFLTENSPELLQFMEMMENMRDNTALLKELEECRRQLKSYRTRFTMLTKCLQKALMICEM